MYFCNIHPATTSGNPPIRFGFFPVTKTHFTHCIHKLLEQISPCVAELDKYADYEPKRL